MNGVDSVAEESGFHKDHPLYYDQSVENIPAGNNLSTPSNPDYEGVDGALSKSRASNSGKEAEVSDRGSADGCQKDEAFGLNPQMRGNITDDCMRIEELFDEICGFQDLGKWLELLIGNAKYLGSLEEKMLFTLNVACKVMCDMHSTTLFGDVIWSDTRMSAWFYTVRKIMETIYRYITTRNEYSVDFSKELMMFMKWDVCLSSERIWVYLTGRYSFKDRAVISELKWIDELRSFIKSHLKRTSPPWRIIKVTKEAVLNKASGQLEVVKDYLNDAEKHPELIGDYRCGVMMLYMDKCHRFITYVLSHVRLKGVLIYDIYALVEHLSRIHALILDIRQPIVDEEVPPSLLLRDIGMLSYQIEYVVEMLRGSLEIIGDSGTSRRAENIVRSRGL
jgi:hypothetical protein